MSDNYRAMVFKKIKKKIKHKVLSILKYIPINSKYIGPPKGYYTVKEYWSNYKNRNNIKINYISFLNSGISTRNYPKSIHK